MMESMNLRAGIRASLLRTAQSALAELPQKLSPVSRNATIATPIRPQSMPRTLERKRNWRSIDSKPAQSYPETEIADLELNPRQWLLAGNPRLATAITDAIGDRWTTHLEDLQQLAPLADNPTFQSRWRAVKWANKQILANILYLSQGIHLNVDSLFDLQLQSVGGQQRQLLNVLHIIALCDRLKQQPDLEIVPRTFIFANLGEIEPAEILSTDEAAATLKGDLAILELIQSLAKIVAADPEISQKLQIVYIPEAATLTHQLYAAADVTQRIATARMEDVDLSQLQAASNGVLSIGSLGKTNDSIQQTVGAENYFGFGLTIPEIALFKEYGYDPYNYYKYYPEIRQAIDCLLSGYFTPDDLNLGSSIVDELLGADEYMVVADYIFYAACQERVNQIYTRPSEWTKMSILNVAGVG